MADLTYEVMLKFITEQSALHLKGAREAISRVPSGERVVHLVGSENNIFLKLVAKRCKELYITVKWHYPHLSEVIVGAHEPVVYDSGDKTLRSPGGSIMGCELDLPQGPHPTAVAQALAELLHFVKETTGWSTVTIVGRGDATYTLPQLLIRDDWSVTQLHSKSPAHAFHMSEVYVNTAPTLQYPLAAVGLIVNIGGSYENPWRSAMSCERIGPLTVAIMVQNIALCLENGYYHSKISYGGAKNG